MRPIVSDDHRPNRPECCVIVGYGWYEVTSGTICSALRFKNLPLTGRFICQTLSSSVVKTLPR